MLSTSALVDHVSNYGVINHLCMSRVPAVPDVFADRIQIRTGYVIERHEHLAERTSLVDAQVVSAIEKSKRVLPIDGWHQVRQNMMEGLRVCHDSRFGNAHIK